MDRPEPVKPYHAVKLRQHPIGIAGNVVSAVAYVAGVKAYSDMIADVFVYHVYDRAYLLKRNADFRSLAAHRLYENRCRHILREERIQTFRSQTASDLAARLDVSARVKVI